jgi:drug/metabolite transporter (DMT)-like permease
MMWFPLALGSAFFFALQSAAGKRLGQTIHGDVVAWLAFVAAAPIYLFALWLHGLPSVQGDFLMWLATSMAINLFAIPLYFRALARGELSIVLPLASLSPLFALGTEYLMLGEVPTANGAVGVPLIVLGAYLLHGNSLRQGLIEPLRRLFADPGARMAIATAALWSVTAVADRGAVLASSPAYYLSVFSVCYTAAFLPWLFWRRQASLRLAAKRPAVSASVGLAGAGMALCQMTALGLASAAVVIAVKRLAALFGIVMGGMWFQEQHLWTRAIAGGFMVAGAVVLALG